MQQQRYWNYLVQTIGHSRYLQYYHEKSEETERNISICAAITSSASIAGWAMWKDLSWLWATIIASSQVLSAIRVHLPFARRAEVLREATSAFKSLAGRIEGKWFRVQDGQLSEDEISELINQFRQEQLEIENKTFAKVTLKERADLLALAEKQTLQYIELNYGQNPAD